MRNPVRDRKHEYTLGAYGLTESRVEKVFGDYTSWANSINS
jgi:hypothetical protein